MRSSVRVLLFHIVFLFWYSSSVSFFVSFVLFVRVVPSALSLTVSLNKSLQCRHVSRACCSRTVVDVVPPRLRGRELRRHEWWRRRLIGRERSKGDKELEQKRCQRSAGSPLRRRARRTAPRWRAPG